MNEADVGNLTSEVETDRTRQKIKRDFAKFRRILQEKVQLLRLQKIQTFASHFSSKFIVFVYAREQLAMSSDFFIKGNLQEDCWLILQ